MGILRLLLAISVIAVHIAPIFGLTLVGGTIAVQLFYIISGFYMCLVLTEKYNMNPKILFYTNRILKLYPIYIFTLIATIVLSYISLYVLKNDILLRKFNHFYQLDWYGKILIITTNIIIIGQDLLFFLGYNLTTKKWFFETSYSNSIAPLHHYLFIGQAWTISLELMFYFVAPFLVKVRNSKLLWIMIISLSIRFISYFLNFNHSPWDYQFFPFELALFIGGMLSYRLMLRFGNFYSNQINQKLFFIYIITTILSYQFLPVFEIFKWILYSTFVLGLPLVFKLTRKSHLDRKIGELSYPVYIIHILVAVVVLNIVDFNSFKGDIVATVSILASILLNKFLQQPIESFRQKRLKNENSN